MNLSRMAVVVLGFVVACGCSEGRRSQVPDGGYFLPDAGGDGGPVLVRTIICDGESGDGKYRVHHEVLRYSDGSASCSCTIRGTEGGASSSASYYYGQTGQPGGDCFMEIGSAWWRLTLVQDESFTMVSPRKEWLVPCRTFLGT